MDDYISKPINPRELARTIERWTDPAATRREGPARAAGRTSEGGGASAPGLSLAELRERVGDDPETLATILRTFAEGAAARAAAMRDAVGRGDRETVAREAHSLKGAAGNVGAEAIRRLAADFERAQPSDAEAMIEALERELDAVRSQIREMGIAQTEER
jgi:two-component system sensor histidine kinase/response regulator